MVSYGLIGILNKRTEGDEEGVEKLGFDFSLVFFERAPTAESARTAQLKNSNTHWQWSPQGAKGMVSGTMLTSVVVMNFLSCPARGQSLQCA